MKNGGGSKADEAMQGETTQNLEDENVLKRPSDDHDVVCRLSISSDSTQVRVVGKRLGKKKVLGRGWDGLSGTT